MIVDKKWNTEFEPRHLSRPDSYRDRERRNKKTGTKNNVISTGF